MKSLIRITLLLTIVACSTNCASILSKSTYPFRVTTKPDKADIEIVNGRGKTIFFGKSPATVRLKAGDGFFKRAEYTVYVSAPGYDEQILPVNFRLDGWYFGNLLIGGVIGMLIIDPLTGAMYKLEDEYMSVRLTQKVGSNEGPGLEVINLVDLSPQDKEHLVRIK